MEQIICQSCGMPMTIDADFGTNKGGDKNTDYCTYCYKEGAFTEDLTMDEMIDRCVQYLDEFNKEADQKMTKEEAVSAMKMHFPNLKRWKIQ